MRILFVCLLLWGCASPDPRYFSLEREPGPIWQSPARTVVVRSVSVPRYLERDEIVRSSDGGRVRVSSNNWWSEPLRNMLQRVLAADLSQRLPDVEVLGTETLGGQGASVLLAIERFEPDGTGALNLDGHLAIQSGGRDRMLQRISFRLALPGTGIGDQVRTMSFGLGQIADTAAAALARSTP